MENDYTFVADAKEMKVEISYTFNASALGGKKFFQFAADLMYFCFCSVMEYKLLVHNDTDQNHNTNGQ